MKGACGRGTRRRGTLRVLRGKERDLFLESKTGMELTKRKETFVILLVVMPIIHAWEGGEGRDINVKWRECLRGTRRRRRRR